MHGNTKVKTLFHLSSAENYETIGGMMLTEKKPKFSEKETSPSVILSKT